MTPEQKSKKSKSARRRGKRGEYLLRNYLRSMGWIADRVPTSGAAQGFKGDVKASKDGRNLTFENKNHSKKFAQFWVFMDEVHRNLHDDVVSVAVPGIPKQCCDISTSIAALLDADMLYVPVARHPLYEKYSRTLDRLGTLYKLVQDSDILVLKDDRKPFLFFRFR